MWLLALWTLLQESGRVQKALEYFASNIQISSIEDEPKELLNNFLTHHNNFPADHDDFFAGHDDFPAGSFDAGQALNEPDNLDAKFWEPGDKLYHNCHPKLNGTFLEALLASGN